MQSLDRLMSILEAVASAAEPVGAAHVSQATGLQISTASRLMIQFAESGLLYRASQDRKYVLGPRLYALARGAHDQLDMSTIGRPHLMRLRDATGETATLHVLRGTQRICIVEVQSHHEVRRVVSVGQGESLEGSATGAVLLCALQPEDQRRQLASLRLSGSERTRFQALIEHARDTGWALVADDWVNGLCGLSALVVGANGPPAAISVSGPSFRFTDRVARVYIETLLDAARMIADAMGGDSSVIDRSGIQS